MLALQGEAEAHGATVALRTRVTAARPGPRGLEVAAEGGGAVTRLRTRLLVNAAGLGAGAVAAAIEGLAPAHRRQVHYCKGSYFGIGARAPFRHLVYPVPERDGLGVHLTLDLAGRARFGPDTEWIAAPDYAVDPARAAGFYAAIRRYWPGLADGALQPDYAGIRPKLHPAGGPATDFAIEGPESPRAPGPREPLRHREPRAHRLARHRRRGGGDRRDGLKPFACDGVPARGCRGRITGGRMQFSRTRLADAMVIDMQRLEDSRGFFARTFCAREFAEAGLVTDFVQDSQSYNRTRGTLRGMHFQVAPHRETKLVRCIAGAVYDVIVDLRPGSPATCSGRASSSRAAERPHALRARGLRPRLPDARGRHPHPLRHLAALRPGGRDAGCATTIPPSASPGRCRWRRSPTRTPPGRWSTRPRGVPI